MTVRVPPVRPNRRDPCPACQGEGWLCRRADACTPLECHCDGPETICLECEGSGELDRTYRGRGPARPEAIVPVIGRFEEDRALAEALLARVRKASALAEEAAARALGETQLVACAALVHWAEECRQSTMDLLAPLRRLAPDLEPDGLRLANRAAVATLKARAAFDLRRGVPGRAA